MKKYNYSKQKINNSDITNVKKTLLFQDLSRGPAVRQFEKNLKKYTKSKYVVAVNNGTSALIAAIRSLSLKNNSTIAVPNITFVASASSVLLSGYKVKLVDVSEKSGLIEPETLKKVLKKNKISCLINVHLNGNIGDLKSIRNICNKFKVKIIDDACHALGTKFKKDKKNYNICDNSFCDISTLSFHPTKLITTGEGGAVLTNNKKIYEKLLKIVNHGYEKYRLKNKNFYHNYYKIYYPGYNFRISDINCSLGLSQLANIKNKILHRRKIAKYYNLLFKGNKFVDYLQISKDTKCSYHLYPIFLKNYYKINKLKLMNNLKKKNIFTQIHYLPLNKQPFLKEKNKFFPKSQEYFNKEISIPIHEHIELKDAKYIANTIIKEIEKIYRN